MTLQELTEIHADTHAALSPWKIKQVRAALGRVRTYERGNMDLKDAIEVVFTCLATSATDYPSIVLAATDAKMERILNGKESPISAMREIVSLDVSAVLSQVLVFRPTGGLMAIFRNGTVKHWGDAKGANEAIVWPLGCIEKLAAVHNAEAQKRVDEILNQSKK